MLSASLKSQFFIELHKEHLRNIISLYQSREYASENWFATSGYVRKIQHRMLASIDVLKSQPALYLSILKSFPDEKDKRAGDVFALGLATLYSDQEDFLTTLKQNKFVENASLSRAYLSAILFLDEEVRCELVKEIISNACALPQLFDVLSEKTFEDKEDLSNIIRSAIEQIRGLDEPERERLLPNFFSFLTQQRTKLADTYRGLIPQLTAKTLPARAALIELRYSVGLDTSQESVNTVLLDKKLPLRNFLRLASLLETHNCLSAARLLDKANGVSKAYLLSAVSGSTEWIPWLIERMQDSNAPQAAFAGLAFTLITGISLEAEPYGRAVVPFSREHQEFTEAGFDDYLGLPLPNCQAVARLWQQMKSNYDPKARYMSGQKLIELSQKKLAQEQLLAVYSQANTFYQQVLRGIAIRRYPLLEPTSLPARNGFAQL